MLWTDALRPGRMHDATATRSEGIAVCYQHFPDEEALLDDGYSGLRRDHPGQAITPPRKANKTSPPLHEARLQARHQHSSRRISVSGPGILKGSTRAHEGQHPPAFASH